jgi:hypothetical protein
MSHPGVSPEAQKGDTLGWRREAFGEAGGAKDSRSTPSRQTATLPNTRVQRTRSSASPPHSPLTRYPLGGAWRLRAEA